MPNECGWVRNLPVVPLSTRWSPIKIAGHRRGRQHSLTQLVPDADSRGCPSYHHLCKSGSDMNNLHPPRQPPSRSQPSVYRGQPPLCRGDAHERGRARAVFCFFLLKRRAGFMTSDLARLQNASPSSSGPSFSPICRRLQRWRKLSAAGRPGGGTITATLPPSPPNLVPNNSANPPPSWSSPSSTSFEPLFHSTDTSGLAGPSHGK